jgi:nucleotide-binding universal stress UspA family protein
MIHRILVPLDPSSYSDVALDYACKFAREHKAEITGIVVLDLPGISKSIGPVPHGGLYYAEKLEKYREHEASKQIKKTLSKFRTKCEKEKVVYLESERLGSPEKIISDDAMFYDLVIMGLKNYFHFETKKGDQTSVDDLLDYSITPILAVPSQYIDIKKVLIAFDGSLAAARALQGFAHLATGYNFQITVLISHPDEEIGNYYLDQAELYLKTYSLACAEKRWTLDPILHALRTTHFEQSDLIVAGVHSKRGLAKYFVGSVAKFLINEAKKPLFLSP